MDFYYQTGKMAVGSRLRRLSDRFTEDAAKIYALYGVDLDPKWFPVFYLLSHQAEASITEIAQRIGHSHASVSQIVKEMKQAKLAIADKSTADGRVNIVKLSEAGRQITGKIEQLYADVNQGVDQLLSESQSNLWKAIAEVELLLSDKSFFDRVREIRKKRESQQVEIIDYTPQFQEDFRRLNYEWIEKYFRLEEADYQSLHYPEEKILHKGGHIFLAQSRGAIVGTCALLKKNDETYELAKMAVAESERGKGIGWLLGQAAIQKVRELGGATVFLESNTVLEPAIRLYQKLGFRRIVGQPSPYDRCNIQMELKLVQ